MTNIDEVKEYWNENPVHSIEFEQSEDLKKYFQDIDNLRWSENDRWAREVFYDFEGTRDKKILDAGCGVGVFSRYYAKKGFDVHAIDITEKAVELTKKSFELFGLAGEIKVGSVEEIPYEDGFFDYVVSNGVIHHTPDTEKAVSEIYRVLKPGGIASICIYYKNIFLRPPLWYLSKAILPFVLSKSKGREKVFKCQTPEDFVKVYDGNETPIAKVYSKEEADTLFKDFKTLECSPHYFPARFLKLIPVGSFVHKVLDHKAGVLIYYLLQK